LWRWVLAPTLAALELLWVRDLATKHGLRIRSYREFVHNGLV